MQPLDVVTPAYVISVDIQFANNLFKSALAVVDTGSPISLLREQLFPLNTVPIANPLIIVWRYFE